MNARHCDRTHEYRGRGATRQGFAWRNALSGLVSPMVRLHQLRNLRTHMLHSALEDLDRCKDA
ncbi:MAG: hypothetical protein ACE5OQ_10175 [Woeseia sp.]